MNWLHWLGGLGDWLSALPPWAWAVAIGYLAMAPISLAASSKPFARWASAEFRNKGPAARHFGNLVNDVLVRPSVGPVAGWFIGALILLVVVLTIQFAPGAAERAERPLSETAAEGVIPVAAGYWTILIVAAVSVAFGLEPILGPRLYRWRQRRRARWSLRERPAVLLARRDLGATVLKLPVAAAKFAAASSRQLALLVWQTPSVILSLADYLLARPMAWLTGACLRPWWLRYAWGLLVVSAGAWHAWTFPAPGGLAGFAVGVAAILAVVRRWNWIERDREAFLAARGSDPAVEKIGFAEDLRDEALLGIVALFLLIPLGFRQVDLAYGAFDLAAGAAMPPSALGQIVAWMGFFGAELAKAVPLVDWSEVFHVANGSPIKPHTVLGAQIVFAMRASLDLLLIAAVLQAAQVAGRLRDQEAAFKADRLPILDPFAERRAFLDVAAASMEEHPHVSVTRRPKVRSFPHYDENRLIGIAKGPNTGRALRQGILGAPAARRGALAVLVRQANDARADKPPADKAKVDEVLASLIKDRAEDPGLRLLAVDLLAEGGEARARQVLKTVLQKKDTGLDALRENAARWLGRLRCKDAADELLERLEDGKEGPAIRVQAGLALAKLGDQQAVSERAVSELRGLARGFEAELKGDGLIPAMSTAYALALLTGGASGALADLFAAGLQPHALRAIRSALKELDQMVEIPAGDFKMGAPDGEEGALNLEVPQHRVRVPAFELGRFTVTFEEYDAFCAATARKKPDDEGWGRERRPVIGVSWHDAHDYCDWLNAFTGERFRLPSEAEWEYACRAGMQTPFSLGDTISTDQANYDGNFTYGSGRKGAFRERTVPVDDEAFEPNAFGLFHMHGNVWEWCQDAFNWSYEATGDRETERPDDGSPWLTGDTNWRVLRGGSWIFYPRILRSA